MLELNNLFFIIGKVPDEPYQMEILNLEILLPLLNQELSLRFDHIKSSKFGPHEQMTDFVHHHRILLSWDLKNDNYLGLGVLFSKDLFKIQPVFSTEELMEIRRLLIKHDICKLLFPTDVLQNEFYNDLKKQVNQLRPTTLLDLIHCDLMTDIYVVMVELLGLKQEYFYQTFILFLNKTVKKADNQDELPSLEEIIKPFLNKGSLEEYQKLFFYYLEKRDLNIFDVHCLDYTPNFSLK